MEDMISHDCLDDLYSVAVTSDNQYIFVGCRDGSIKRVKFQTKEEQSKSIYLEIILIS